MAGEDEDIEEPAQAGDTPLEEEAEEKDEVLEARIEELRQKELTIPKTFNWPNRAHSRAHFQFGCLPALCFSFPADDATQLLRGRCHVCSDVYIVLGVTKYP